MSIALVTGGNRGLGLATAGLLAERGHQVIIGCRDAEAGAQAANRLGGANGNVAALTMDVTDPATVTAAAKEVRYRHRTLGSGADRLFPSAISSTCAATPKNGKESVFLAIFNV